MTIQEFKNQVIMLMNELNKDSDEHLIFIFIVNENTGEGLDFGYGCPACMVEHLIEAYKSREFKHHSEKHEVH